MSCLFASEAKGLELQQQSFISGMGSMQKKYRRHRTGYEKHSHAKGTWHILGGTQSLSFLSQHSRTNYTKDLQKLRIQDNWRI